jgi:hypothetical protein
VRDCRVQLEIAFVLISSKVQVGTVPCKECVGQVKTQSCDSERRESKTAAMQVCAESRRLQHLVMFEDLPQGVCARSFFLRVLKL